MEEATNQLFEKTQEAQDEVLNFSFEHLRDKLEYFTVKANFFENQTLIFNELINKEEMICMELLKEEQELTDKLMERAEVKKNLVNILKGLKNERKAEKHKFHINKVHRQLKPNKCSDCTKGKHIKSYHLKYFIK